jgi:uncharacterized protein (DUF885 family)
MNKQIFYALALTILLASCKGNPRSNQTSSGDIAFQKLSEEFLEGYISWRPQYGVYLGFHEYDGRITDFHKKSIDSELSRLKAFEQKFSSIDTATLSSNMKFDHRIFLNAIRNEILNFEDLQVFKYNPMVYFDPSGLIDGILAMDLSIYLNRSFAPLEDRFKSILSLEKEIPKIVAYAEFNLADSLAKPYIESAIEIVYGSIDFLKNDLELVLKDIKNDSLIKSYKSINKVAVDALAGFVSYLEKEKVPKATNNYAIGIKNFQKMLLYEDISITPDILLQIGLKELEREQEAFKSAAKIINPETTPLHVFSSMKKEHPTAETLIPQSATRIEALWQFIVNKNLLTIPSNVRVKVKEMPQFLRSYAAMMDIPGPFDTKATEAYYFITPVNPQWTAKQKDEWLSLFNYYTSDLIAIHEAYPGHYVQFLHVNASSASKIEKVYMDYAFTEGWAHYTEQMMIEEGFGNSGNPIEASKYKLAQLNESLVRLCRYCVSRKMHCFGMSVDEAAKFFIDNCYLGEKPAQLEAIRATYDPRSIFYTLGKLQIIKLREDYKKQEGANFSLQKFHDKFLDHGMPTIQQMRETLLKDNLVWDDIL